MNFWQHLGDLRIRFIRCLVAFIAATIVCAFFANDAIRLLAAPIGKLIFTRPMEAFEVQVKLACYMGLLVSLPYLIYQIWSFVALGLEKKERSYIRIAIPVSYFSFLLGVALAGFVVFPNTMRFLLSFQDVALEPLLSVEAYLDFLCVLCLAFGILFQLPLILHWFARVGVTDGKFLMHNRRSAYILLIILAALLNPVPEAIAHLFLSGVGILLYELSIWLIQWEVRRRKKALKPA